MFTHTQRRHLVVILTLIEELDKPMPSNNTEERLVARSGLSEKDVAWCIDVLWNDGEGWLDYGEHPKTGERGYFTNSRFEDGDLASLYRSWKTRQADILTFDRDDEDPDDEWQEGTYED